MKLQYDRQITVSIGNSRKSTNWVAKTTTIANFYSPRLEQTTKGFDTITEYLGKSKAEQDELKDVGGFVIASLNGPRRKQNAVISRDGITLDLDNIPPYSTQKVVDACDNFGCGYAIYSTRKHRQEMPRLRVIIITNRSMTPDEHEALARYMASLINIAWADKTTFEAHRLMYWPSTCADGEYFWTYKDAPLLDVDATLASAYTDWHDTTLWPRVPGELDGNTYKRLAVRQGDPEAKTGVVGYFNRARGSVLAAMEIDIPGVYQQTDSDPNRYTYLGGSTAGGAVIYDDGKFLFSHHATDPCSGKLVNAFDMVRLHKFEQLDDTVLPGTPINRLPSFNAMCEYAVADADVSALMAKERHEQALKEFENLSPDNADDAVNWMSKLELHPKTGAIKPTIDNIRIILENDPALKDKFALNQFASRGEVLGVLPWSSDTRRRLWSDTDSNGLYWYLEKAYNVTGRGNIDAALDIHAATHAFNEVQNFLNRLKWDGTPRLDTLFIDYLGAADDDYTRAVCRKSFTAAVARAMIPGSKFDNMLILCGPQGIGKSTILDKMSKGWYNDSIRTFEGKEASELLQGVWLVEVAELDAFRRTDVARIKQFLSLRADRYRAAYGRNVKELPRCCVFFGTCNQMDFLQDTTGNRRFWPVDVGVIPAVKNVWRDLTDDVIDQIWAEAKVRWQMGEATYLSGEVEKAAQERQEQHREASAREGIIQEFVSKQVPSDWSKWTIDRRRDFWAGAVQGDFELVDRDRICAIEVWCELFNGNTKDLKNMDTREINATLSNIPGWERAVFRCGPYSTQRGYILKRK